MSKEKKPVAPQPNQNNQLSIEFTNNKICNSSAKACNGNPKVITLQSASQAKTAIDYSHMILKFTKSF